jgi:hypothetical protein
VADHHTYFVGSREWTFSVWVHNAFYRDVVDYAAKFRDKVDPDDFQGQDYDAELARVAGEALKNGENPELRAQLERVLGLGIEADAVAKELNAALDSNFGGKTAIAVGAEGSLENPHLIIGTNAGKGGVSYLPVEVRQTLGVPAGETGEWNGTWKSSATGKTYEITVLCKAAPNQHAEETVEKGYGKPDAMATSLPHCDEKCFPRLVNSNIWTATPAGGYPAGYQEQINRANFVLRVGRAAGIKGVSSKLPPDITLQD